MILSTIFIYGALIALLGVYSLIKKKFRGVFFFLLLFWIVGFGLLYPFSQNHVDYADTTIVTDIADQKPNLVLPLPEGEKPVSFVWKYKGKNYSTDLKLYESYYQYYNLLPAYFPSHSESPKVWHRLNNEMFLNGVPGDSAIDELASKLMAIIEGKKMTSDQAADFITVFVQTIPYDFEKLDRRKSGLDGAAEKTTYPYEVLYQNMGVCQDKSYLAYQLLKKFGYGVAIFLFPNPEDNHMAIGIQCPLKYSNYESGYCFLETTSLGNKIGMIPSLMPQSRIATSEIPVDAQGNLPDEEQYRPLGNVEILNAIEGKEYTGIVATISTQKELERLKDVIYTDQRALKVYGAVIDGQEADLNKMEKRLKSLKKDGQYNDYNDLVKKYNSLLSQLRKNIQEYNHQVAAGNGIIAQYKSLAHSFYQ